MGGHVAAKSSLPKEMASNIEMMYINDALALLSNKLMSGSRDVTDAGFENVAWQLQLTVRHLTNTI